MKNDMQESAKCLVAQGQGPHNEDVTCENQSLGDLFAQKMLCIPEYQRSYSWQSSHIQDLLKDTFDRTTPYLMGTVILHDNKDQGSIDIVDGQQRLVTLTVLLYILDSSLKCLPLLGSKFNEGSARLIRKTHEIIRAFLVGKSDNEKEAFRNRLLPADDTKSFLMFTVILLSGENALDQAYTFFDSVNSKGKRLSDYDLLKADHLMYIPASLEALAVRYNDEWLSRDESHADLFGTILRRIRMWSRNQDRDSKRERPDYEEFCAAVEPEPGVDSQHVFSRYMQPVAFRSWRRVGDKILLSMDYPIPDAETLMPTEVTQTVEGGEAFFLYAKHYHKLYKALFVDCAERPSTAISFIRELARAITNDKLRNAFRAVILLYADKFGEDRLIEVGVCMEHIISAWRWSANSLRIEGTLSHVHDKCLVPILLESVNSWHAYSQLLAVAQSITTPTKALQGIKLRYRESLIRFYTQERPKIVDAHALSLIKFYIVAGNKGLLT